VLPAIIMCDTMQLDDLPANLLVDDAVLIRGIRSLCGHHATALDI
jgi:hypothetical protein